MDRYSRMIVLLKVLLPLIALALLSTLFLVSRNVDPLTTIPFAQTEVEERLRDQQITGPFFSGSTTRGDQISFSARKIEIDSVGGMTQADNFAAQIYLKSGANITFSADVGTMNISQDTSVLSGNVVITTSSGYKINSDQLMSSLSTLDIESPDMVEAKGPIGEITAGAMRLSALDDTKNAQLVFTNRVKLIYDPKIHRDERP